MAFQSVPNAAEIIITYSLNTEIMVNVLGASIVGGYDLADLVALAVAVDAVVASDWLPEQSQDAAYLSTTVRGLEFENDQQTTVDSGAGPGERAEGALPGNVTFSVKKLSSFTGRSARGRMYWIGMVPSMLQPNENLVNTADAILIQDALEAMRVGITATDWTAAIVSRFTGGVERDFGIFFEWVETVFVNKNVDSMRTRLIR